MRNSSSTPRLLLIRAAFITACSVLHADPGHLLQQGGKLVGTGYQLGSLQRVLQGSAVALSGDGNTALVSGALDNNGQGAVWVFTRTNGIWSQQGNKLVGTGASPGPNGAGSGQGESIALSADGTTAAIGAPFDANGVGAVWVFGRNNGVWTQQGPKLVGSRYDRSQSYVLQGAVALSADGNTLLVGGPGDNDQTGAVWVFTRSSGVWSQQGGKLVGSGALVMGGPFQGASVALSADGNTAAWGGPNDANNGSNGANGAVWVFVRQNGSWFQQGPKLTGSDVAGLSAFEGSSVALSGNGDTLVFGGPLDNFPTSTSQCALPVGALWVFVRSDGVWTQQGEKLVPSGAVGCDAPKMGGTVSISTDGNALVTGGYADGSQDSADANATGAAWVFVRSRGTWSQQGSKLVGTSAVGAARQGLATAISGDGNTVLVGGPFDDIELGAIWVFTSPALGVTLTPLDVFHRGETGAAYTATVTNHGERATTSPVNLVDRIPNGLVATNIAGTGWTCTLATVSCTRADPLAVGAAYPPVTITVNVALNAPAIVTNVAVASGGGSAWGDAKDVTVIQK